ncbi:chloroplastic group IIA intron splicing facilitator CRS1, chloroplastic isoform X2 [Mercurialis annua]|uniref:chloroplastic group IIA intron splicing facilitator CRS1, chloroplastic isoform X2 n=1 Tax=Mercurialis annua TaxID=3986 RepID=UPI002160ECD8|nr:chloroplastic group IIA intron splicing facilitator CRS1, chloroplastic isoform X2 [Mercurialis annua]
MPSTQFFQFFSYIPITSSLNKNNAQNPSFPTYKTTEFTLSSDSNSQSNAPIKMPTAPWMNGPLLLQPHEVLNLSKSRKNNPSKKAQIEKSDKALTAKESGVRGNKAMKNIIKTIEKLQKDEALENTQFNSEVFEKTQVRNSEGFEIVDKLAQIGGNGDRKKLQPWESEEKIPVKLEAFEMVKKPSQSDGDGEFRKMQPWEKEDKFVYWRMKKEKVVTKAELSLDKELLEKLRSEAAEMRTWVKVMKAGVTQSVVDRIRLAWNTNELAMVKFHLPLSRNMDRARDILEMKTGGLVVWTRKDIHVIYRGCNLFSEKSSGVSTVNEKIGSKDGEEEYLSTSVFIKDADKEQINGSLFEREVDRLLDGLGPRYVDWWMRKPLPVDGDSLPEVVAGFTTPFRFQYGRSKLWDNELTYLRKLARAQPTHFVLGRNRRLQGLAAAILKLWQKSLIAKIAVKWGIPNSDNEQMANELKHLTGGVLLLRNKYFIILFRGKDFLPCQIASLVEDREDELKSCQLNEEAARLKATESETCVLNNEFMATTSKLGTLNEYQDIQVKFKELEQENRDSKLQLEAKREKLEKELRIQEYKLLILQRKIEKAARELSKLNAAWAPAEQDADLEMMTEEERECLRKIGLKMHSSLLLGVGSLMVL